MKNVDDASLYLRWETKYTAESYCCQQANWTPSMTRHMDGRLFNKWITQAKSWLWYQFSTSSKMWWSNALSWWYCTYTVLWRTKGEIGYILALTHLVLGSMSTILFPFESTKKHRFGILYNFVNTNPCRPGKPQNLLSACKLSSKSLRS